MIWAVAWAAGCCWAAWQMLLEDSDPQTGCTVITNMTWEAMCWAWRMCQLLRCSRGRGGGGGGGGIWHEPMRTRSGSAPSFWQHAMLLRLLQISCCRHIPCRVCPVAGHICRTCVQEALGPWLFVEWAVLTVAFANNGSWGWACWVSRPHLHAVQAVGCRCAPFGEHDGCSALRHGCLVGGCWEVVVQSKSKLFLYRAE